MVMDVLDLTSLQKRGLLKIPLEEESAPDVIDLTQKTGASAVAPASQNTPSDSSSAFDFLSGFAQLGAHEVSSSTASSQLASSSVSSGSSDVADKLDTILSKIEDTMYKIEVLSSRVAQLESRLRS